MTASEMSGASFGDPSACTAQETALSAGESALPDLAAATFTPESPAVSATQRANFTLREILEIREALRMSHILMNVSERKWGIDRTIAHASHTSEVGLLLMAAGAGRELILAGFLHDLFEGYIPGNRIEHEEFVTSRFGPRVTALIRAVTEPPKSSESGNWWERKSTVLDQLKNGDPEVAALTCAIKISTLSEGNLFLETGGAIEKWSAGSYADNLTLFRMYLTEFERWQVAAPLLDQYRHELQRFTARSSSGSGEKIQ